MDDKEMKRIISSNLKTILKEYNINQSELAKIAGVSESTAGKWILKKSTPRMGAIQKIADHFNLPKSYILEEKRNKNYIPFLKKNDYPFYPVSVSAGLPLEVDAITEAETISIPDVVMGKWAGNKDIYIMHVNGDSMNCVMPHNSLIAVKRVELSELNNGDIVVYSDDYEYAVKRFYKDGDRLIFRPDSTDQRFTDHIITTDNMSNLNIYGKVVLYIVELD